MIIGKIISRLSVFSWSLIKIATHIYVGWIGSLQIYVFAKNLFSNDWFGLNHRMKTPVFSIWESWYKYINLKSFEILYSRRINSYSYHAIKHGYIIYVLFLNTISGQIIYHAGLNYINAKTNSVVVFVIIRQKTIRS